MRATYTCRYSLKELLQITGASGHNEYRTLTEVFLNLTEVFLTLPEIFSCFFLSCKANARVKLAKKGHGPHSS
jgi:hypothetical protein